MASIKLEDLEIYKVSMEIGELVWSEVLTWDNFAKNSLGNQLVRSADSISLNIAEGYGRFHFKENKNFNYYSRGSAKETFSGLDKAKNRNLISIEKYNQLNEKLNLYFRLSFAYINSIGNFTNNKNN